MKKITTGHPVQIADINYPTSAIVAEINEKIRATVAQDMRR